MLSKICISLFVIGVFFTTGSISAFAQFAQLNGIVVLDKGDGTKEPVSGALVEAYRFDIKSVSPPAKTNKNGAFVFGALPFRALFAVSVSAPGCAPQVFPNIRIGVNDNVSITLSPGDGKRLTEDEARKAVADSLKNGTAGGDLTAEQKAEMEKNKAEFAKKNKEIEEKNNRIKTGDATARKANEDGIAAKKAGDYDTAIARFNEGIAAVPDFIGSTPILLLGKMDALKLKGYKIYREGVVLTDAAARRAKFDEANTYFDQALAALPLAMAVFKSADPADLKGNEGTRIPLYSLATEVHRLKAVTGIDTSKTNDAFAVVTEYIVLEQDPAKKLAGQMTLGDIMRNAGDFERAVAAYRKVLEMKPDYPDALAGLGLTLFAQGAGIAPEDKEKEQEGLNYMTKYTEISPVTASDSLSVQELKKSVKDAVEYLKSLKMAPQKVPASGKKKP